MLLRGKAGWVLIDKPHRLHLHLGTRDPVRAEQAYVLAVVEGQCKSMAVALLSCGLQAQVDYKHSAQVRQLKRNPTLKAATSSNSAPLLQVPIRLPTQCDPEAESVRVCSIHERTERSQRQ